MNIPWHDLGGAVAFAATVLGGFFAARWLIAALNDYNPHCVYEFDLTDGRIYVGYGRDPQARAKTHRNYQRRLRKDDPHNWWPYVPTDVQESLMPPRVEWFRSEQVAHAEEVAHIRRYDEAGVRLANDTKYRGVRARVPD